MKPVSTPRTLAEVDLHCSYALLQTVMVDHFGDRVLGQMDLLSDGVLLFSGSFVLVCFSKGNSSGISKNEYKEGGGGKKSMGK